MKQLFPLYIFLLLTNLTALAVEKQHLTVNEGLPSNEVRQVIELPNGQILVNCEGTFALFNGSRFVPMMCNRQLTYKLPFYTSGYAHLFQSDTLLWLRDFYRVYLLDNRTRTFRYDIADRLTDNTLKKFIEDQFGTDEITPEQRTAAESANLSVFNLTMGCTDRQGGMWLGTRDNGIFYLPPARQKAEVVTGNDSLARLARGYVDSKGKLWICNTQGVDCYENNRLSMHYDQNNVSGLVHSSVRFVCELHDKRLLLCNMNNCLGYFTPEKRDFQLLNTKLKSLNDHRIIVGACPLPQDNHVIIYTQNGAFILNTDSNTLSPFTATKEIEQYSDKYNCMLLDQQQHLWIGTQNGLFHVQGDSCQRITGLKNNCIRSLVEDNEGSLWVGTSSGISRIQQYSVTNFGLTDGIPSASMLERCAYQTTDGRIVFAQGGTLVIFRPEWFQYQENHTCTIQIVGMEVCGQEVFNPPSSILNLPYNKNYIRLQLSALNYATPEHTHYRYRLSDLDSDWIYSSDGSGTCMAIYNALPPGHYTFKAQAAISGSKWGTLLQKTIIIHPPLWLTWWAKLLYIFLIVASTGYTIHLYLKRRKTKMELENDERVNRLFELRKEARHQFAENINIDVTKISMNIEEEKLMQNLLKAIETHIDNEGYNVDQLASDVFISRTNLYKKIQNMLGITPTDFIRNVRLKRAAQLLATTQLTVKEISVSVGFATSRNFSTQFKKMFGVLPSDYRDGKNKI